MKERFWPVLLVFTERPKSTEDTFFLSNIYNSHVYPFGSPDPFGVRAFDKRRVLFVGLGRCAAFVFRRSASVSPLSL